MQIYSYRPSLIPQVVNGDLLYGSVCLNGFTGQGYAAQNGVWGGVNNTLEDAQSGIGYIHNSKYA
jgi:hypothetical protein